MTIFWDWNGTLVDDVDTVVQINRPQQQDPREEGAA